MSSKATTAALLLATALIKPADAQWPYPRPDKRYQSFQSLSGADQSTAQNALGYTSLTWNVPAEAPVESMGWWQMSASQKAGANALGISENQWDCYINHYQTFTWDELTAAGLAGNYEGLGWSRGSWDGTSDEALPDSEGKWWGQLTESEKTYARNVCYFQDTWNKVDMTPNPSYLPFPFPDFRYVPWQYLSGDMQSVATSSLDYTGAETWDNLETNAPELNTYLNLDVTERDGASELGFYSHTWDCYMNHYDAYYWPSLYGALLIAVETLGWNQQMWENRTTYPDSEATFWEDLTPQERAAATALCYVRETWDGYELSEYYDASTGKTNAIPSTTAVPSDMDFSIFGGQGMPGSNWVLGTLGSQPPPSSSNVRGVSLVATALALLVGAFLSM